MWVVKLGGSLARISHPPPTADTARRLDALATNGGGKCGLASNPVLKDWLEVLVRHGGGRVVIVPGGGPFADAVRAVHRHWNLPEPVAHRMALLAMEQYGLMLAGMQPGLCTVRTADEVADILAQRAVAVWLPWHMVAGPEGQDIEESWDATSDSLAVWLAGRLKARHLVLVKSLEPFPEPVAVAELACAGIVDPLFPVYASKSACVIWWSGSGQHGRMAQALNGSAEPGTRVLLD